MQGPFVQRLVTVAAVALVGSMLGCGPGLAVRGHAAEPIGRAGAGAGAGASAGAGAEASEGEHEDDLPVLPRAAVMEEPDALETAAMRPTTAVASRYGALDREHCEAELDRRHIAYDRVGETRGVIAPLRLRGAIAGVDFHSMLPAAQRRTSPYEIYDCRLVLALDDWARVLARHDVVEVVHYSVYRPPPAKQVLNGAGRRHSGALAIDAAIFKMRDGQTISVEKDFHGRIGSKPCGGSTTGLPAPAVTLRKIVCEAADAQLFNVLLTPDFNWPHRNHFHLEVSANGRWVYLR
ncbi:MAG: hypothetical protein QOI41_1450 [Myxococcales bacterium]|nr:hypothetical protein [Myxococcales bacterium]